MATLDEPANDPLVSQETEVFKAELLATVGHELRGPLTAIKGYAATLLRHERRISREERHEFLVAISAASDRLELIIERFLEISQLETDAIRIERFPVDVARLAHEALTVAEQRASGHSPGRFTFNLRLKDAHLKNAPMVAQKPGRVLEICVCDHGLGIPPEHLGRIFERFHRVDNRLIREVNGLGLGLTMCKHIIELHDGVIWAES